MLKVISQYITYSLLNLEQGSHLADAVYFFIYDTIKIFLLLSVIIFAVSIIRSFFPPKKRNKFCPIKKSLSEIFWQPCSVLLPHFAHVLQFLCLSDLLRPEYLWVLLFLFLFPLLW